jgi:hypothetical protein
MRNQHVARGYIQWEYDYKNRLWPDFRVINGIDPRDLSGVALANLTVEPEERIEETYTARIDVEKKFVGERMASALTSSGDLTGATEAYRSALNVDHGREEVHRELMLVLWKAGRRDEALRQYEACRRVLFRELGTMPTRQTEHLHQAVLAGETPG